MAETAKMSPEDFIRSVFQDHIGREIAELEPMQGNNAQVFRVHIKEGPGISQAPAQPGTVPLPQTSSALVMRLSRPDAMLNEAVRVQNEVALMILMREALGDDLARIVPKVYAWNPSTASGENGWVLMEAMAGEPLGPKFDKLELAQKKDIVQQIARIFKRIQAYQLPETVTGYGGLGFDDDGAIRVGPTAIFGGGPCESHAQLYAEYFQTQLGFADKCDVVQGWKDNELRGRIERFGSDGLKPLLEKFNPKQTLVHGDFDVQNMLFDEETSRITAVLDFDFGHIASHADEYFYSFPRLNGLLVPPFEDHPDVVELRNCLLGGFGSANKRKELQARPAEAIDFNVAIMLDEALADANVQRPQDITGIADLSCIYWFIQNISPPMFFLPRWREHRSPEQIKVARETARVVLENYLDSWGF